jgi:proton-translocating NADH-quinone oxidoreductase chain L
MGKSAQFGLHTWLPDAMEGPTPVSALIHAATMVTAGVFLLIRCSFLFEQASTVLLFIAVVGAFTSIFAATSALVQNDIKKVIAYSTCSQLGYMIFVCGLSGYNVGFFHLVNHAVFKALLFLGAGSVIHSMSNEQDMRRFGGILRLIPYTAVVLFVGSLALIGFPFLAGYYSKDVILETAFASYTVSGNFCYFIGLCTAFFTSFYSYRVVHLTFVAKSNIYKRVAGFTHDAPWFIYSVLFLLSFGSIVVGYLFKDMFIGLGSNFFTQSIFIRNGSTCVNSELTFHVIKLLPYFLVIISVVAVNYVFFYNIRPVTLSEVGIYSFFSYKWYFDVLYNKYLNIPLVQKSRVYLFDYGDKGLLEFFGPLSVENLLDFGHNSLKKFLISDVLLYGLFIVLVVIVAI